MRQAAVGVIICESVINGGKRHRNRNGGNQRARSVGSGRASNVKSNGGVARVHPAGGISTRTHASAGMRGLRATRRLWPAHQHGGDIAYAIASSSAHSARVEISCWRRHRGSRRRRDASIGGGNDALRGMLSNMASWRHHQCSGCTAFIIAPGFTCAA
jgi:hypothetical protein